MSGNREFTKLDDLARRVGYFLLNFGTLEYLLLTFLEKHLTPTEYERVSGLHFKDKVIRLRDVLETAGLGNLTEDEQLKLFEDIESVRTLRNHLAHGQLSLDTAGKGELKLNVTLPKEVDQRFETDIQRVDVSELQRGLDTLALITEQFYGLAGFSAPVDLPIHDRG